MLKLLKTLAVLSFAAVVVASLLQALARPAADAATSATNISASYAKPLREAVADLGVRAERRTGYSRDLFNLWVDADKDGCNTRYEVLISEAVRQPTVGAGCWLRGGSWFSYYDHVTTTNPSTFDIDHLVPLAEAWDSGASAWNADTRTRYANDLSDPRTLVAVTATANRTKSDADPAEWLPRYGRCRYVASWVAVKLRWSLTADRTEKATLTRLARNCPNVTLRVRKAAVTKTGSTTPTGSTAPARSGVRITQISYDAPGADTSANTNGEWVELANTTGTRANLTGWALTDAAGTRYTVPQFVLGAGATVRIHTGTGSDNSGHLYAGGGRHWWNNTGDSAYLTNADGARVSTCSYTPTSTGIATCA